MKLTTNTFFGIALALVATICFAGNRSLPSKPLVSSDPIVPTYISLIIGVLVSGVAVIGSGSLASLTLVTVSIVGIFAVAGIFNFGIGRQLSYVAVKNIGANLTSPLISTQTVYALSFAVLFLGETLNSGILSGAVLILLGSLLLEGHSGAIKRRGKLRLGYGTALLAAGIFGLVPILIRMGLAVYHFSISATFLSYAAAMLVYAVAARPAKITFGIRGLSRIGLIYYVAAGILVVVAQLLRFGALTYAPVVTVAPILASQPIFTVLITRKFAEGVEIFQARTMVAILIVVAGAILVSLASGGAS